jgi:hypothetical protein
MLLQNKTKTAFLPITFGKIGGFFVPHCEIFRSNLELIQLSVTILYTEPQHTKISNAHERSELATQSWLWI